MTADMFNSDKKNKRRKIENSFQDKAKLAGLVATAITASVVSFVGTTEEASADTYKWDEYYDNGYYYETGYWYDTGYDEPVGYEEIVYETVEERTWVPETYYCYATSTGTSHNGECVDSSNTTSVSGGYWNVTTKQVANGTRFVQTGTRFVKTGEAWQHTGYAWQPIWQDTGRKVYSTDMNDRNYANGSMFRNRTLINFAPIVQNTVLTGEVYKNSILDVEIQGYDAEGDTISYSVDNLNPELMTTSISGSTVTVTGKQMGVGTIVLKVTSTNQFGFTETTSKQFKVTVKNNPATLERIDTPSYILLGDTENYTYTGKVHDKDSDLVAVTLTTAGVDFKTENIVDEFAVTLEGNKVANGFYKDHLIGVKVFDGTDLVDKTAQNRTTNVIKVKDSHDYRQDMLNHDEGYEAWDSNQHEKFYNSYDNLLKVEANYSNKAITDFDKALYSLLGVDYPSLDTDTTTQMIEYNNEINNFLKTVEKTDTVIEWLERRNNLVVDHLLDEAETVYQTEDTDTAYSSRTVQTLKESYSRGVNEGLTYLLGSDTVGYNEKSMLTERANMLDTYHTANNHLRSIETSFDSITWAEIEKSRELIKELEKHTADSVLEAKYIDELSVRTLRLERDFMNVKPLDQLTVEDFNKFLDTEGEYRNNKIPFEVAEGLIEVYKEHASMFDENPNGADTLYLGEENRMLELLQYVNTSTKAMTTLEESDLATLKSYVASKPYLDITKSTNQKINKTLVAIDELIEYKDNIRYNTRKNDKSIDMVLTETPILEGLRQLTVEALTATHNYNNKHVLEDMSAEEVSNLKGVAEQKTTVLSDRLVELGLTHDKSSAFKMLEYINNAIAQVGVDGDQYAYINGGNITVSGTIKGNNLKTVEITYDGVTKYATIDNAVFTETDGTTKPVSGTLIKNGDGTYSYSIDFTVTKTDVLADDIQVQVQDEYTWKQHTIKDKPVILIDSANPKFHYLYKLDTADKDGVFKTMVKASESDLGKGFNAMTNVELLNLIKIYDETMKFVVTSSETFEEVQLNRAYNLTKVEDGSLHEYIRYLSSVPHLVRVFENVGVDESDEDNFIGHMHYNDAFDYRDDIILKVSRANLEALKTIARDYKEDTEYTHGDYVPEKEDYARWLALAPLVDDLVKSLENAKNQREYNALVEAIEKAKQSLETLRLELVTPTSDGTWLNAYKTADSTIKQLESSASVLLKVNEVEKADNVENITVYKDVYDTQVVALQEELATLEPSDLNTFIEERIQRLETISTIYAETNKAKQDLDLVMLETLKNTVTGLGDDFKLLSNNAVGQEISYESFDHIDEVNFLLEHFNSVELDVKTTVQLDTLEDFVYEELYGKTNSIVDEVQANVVEEVNKAIEEIAVFHETAKLPYDVGTTNRIKEIEDKLNSVTLVKTLQDTLDTAPETLTFEKVSEVKQSIEALGTDTFNIDTTNIKDGLAVKVQAIFDSYVASIKDDVLKDIEDILKDIEIPVKSDNFDKDLISEIDEETDKLKEQGVDTSDLDHRLQAIKELISLVERVEKMEQVIDTLNLEAVTLYNELTTGEKSIEAIYEKYADVLTKDDVYTNLVDRVDNVKEKVGYLDSLIELEGKAKTLHTLTDEDIATFRGDLENLNTVFESTITLMEGQYPILFKERLDVVNKVNIIKESVEDLRVVNILDEESRTTIKETLDIVREAVTNEMPEGHEELKQALLEELDYIQSIIDIGTALKDFEQELNDLLQNSNNLTKEELISSLEEVKNKNETLKELATEQGVEDKYTESGVEDLLNKVTETLTDIINQLDKVDNLLTELENIIQERPYEKDKAISKIEEVQSEIDKLTDGTTKDSYQEALNKQKEIVDKQLELLQQAEEQSEIFLKDLLVDDLDKLIDILDEMFDSAEKQAIHDKIKEAAEDLLNAVEAVKEAEKELTEYSYSEAVEAVDKLTDGKQKDQLLDRLEEVRHKIDVSTAEKAIDDYENTLTEDKYTVAKELVDMVKPSTEKEKLTERLENIKTSLENAITKVETAEQGFNLDTYNEAKEAVDKLSDNETTYALDNRLQLVYDEGTYLNVLKAIEKFEETYLLADYGVAYKQLELVSDKYVKELTTRLQATYKIVQKAVVSVEEAEVMLTVQSFEAAQELVTALKDTPKKVKLQNRLDSIKGSIEGLGGKPPVIEEVEQPMPEVEKPQIEKPKEESSSYLDTDETQIKKDLEDKLGSLTDKDNLTLDELQKIVDEMPDSIYKEQLQDILDGLYDVLEQHNKGNSVDESVLGVIKDNVNNLEKSHVKDILDRLHGEFVYDNTVIDEVAESDDLPYLKDKVEKVNNPKLKEILEERLKEKALEKLLAEVSNGNKPNIDNWQSIGLDIPEDLYEYFLTYLKDLIDQHGIKGVTLEMLQTLLDFIIDAKDSLLAGETLDITIMKLEPKNSDTSTKVEKEEPKEEIEKVEKPTNVEKQPSKNPEPVATPTSKPTNVTPVQSYVPQEVITTTPVDVQPTVAPITETKEEETTEVVEETTGGIFAPSEEVNRGQYAVVAAKTAGLDTTESTFEDVDGLWYEGYIGALADKGIMVGVSDEAFDPNSAIDTKEVAQVVDRLLRFVALGGGQNGDSNLLNETIAEKSTPRKEDEEQTEDTSKTEEIFSPTGDVDKAKETISAMVSRAEDKQQTDDTAKSEEKQKEDKIFSPTSNVDKVKETISSMVSRITPVKEEQKSVGEVVAYVKKQE